jgi:hypothetical protein
MVVPAAGKFKGKSRLAMKAAPFLSKSRLLNNEVHISAISINDIFCGAPVEQYP